MPCRLDGIASVITLLLQQQPIPPETLSGLEMGFVCLVGVARLEAAWAESCGFLL